MGKDTRLVNIYLKIHNKQNLTMDDLAYLAEYAPECFEKTCRNVVYNVPGAKPIMESNAEQMPKEEPKPESSDQQKVEPNIDQILENLKRLEVDDFPVTDVDADHVKSLLGNLYMELLFPHNDKDTFMDMTNQGNKSLFDKKV